MRVGEGALGPRLAHPIARRQRGDLLLAREEVAPRWQVPHLLRRRALACWIAIKSKSLSRRSCFAAPRVPVLSFLLPFSLLSSCFVPLAMLAALGRTHEFRLHLSGAINNGVTKDEIAEILIQVGGYAGFPCAVDGFRQAREVFKEKNI